MADATFGVIEMHKRPAEENYDWLLSHSLALAMIKTDEHHD
jgi:hypothetical protein